MTYWLKFDGVEWTVINERNMVVARAATPELAHAMLLAKINTIH